MKVHFYEFVSTMQIPPNGIGWDLVKYWNFIYFLVTPSQAQTNPNETNTDPIPNPNNAFTNQKWNKNRH